MANGDLYSPAWQQAKKDAAAKLTAADKHILSVVDAAYDPIFNQLKLDFSNLKKDYDRKVERLQVLLGERGDTRRSGMAVRRSDLSGIGTTSLASKTITTSTPTQADFNALVTDFHAMYNVLSRIASGLNLK